MIHLMRNFSIRTRMIGAIAVLTGALATVGGIGVVSQLHSRTVAASFMQNDFNSVTRSMELRSSMGALQSTGKDVLLQYGHDAEATKANNAWQTRFTTTAAGAKALGDGLKNPAQQTRVADAMSHLDRFKARVDTLSKTPPSKGLDAALVAQAQGEFDQAQGIVDTLSTDIQAQARASGAALETAAVQWLTLLFAAAGLSLGVIVPLTLVNSRSIVGPVREAEALASRIAAGDLGEIDVQTAGHDEPALLLVSLQRMHGKLRGMVSQVRGSTDSIATAASEIATGNQDLSHRTEQTATNLQQAASSMTQLTGTVRQSADSARQANQLASSAAEVAARGGKVVSEVVTTMDEINASSKKISDIISVIDGIAFQTNILALNAAVEAARAGEQGRGFAVVASEVRSLAQRSAQAAKEIKGLIGASVDRVEVGAKLVADAGQTMLEIVSSVQRVTDIIGEITAASSEQSDGISQINTAVTQLDQMTQQNAALVEQSAAAAESLRDQAGKLATAVSTFSLDGSVPKSGASASPPTRTVAATVNHGRPMAPVTARPKPAVSRPSPATAAKMPMAASKPTIKSTSSAPMPPAPKSTPVATQKTAPATTSASATTAPGDDWETF